MEKQLVWKLFFNKVGFRKHFQCWCHIVAWMRLFLKLEEFVVYGYTKTFVNTVRCLMFKRKQEKNPKRLTYQPFHLAKISSSMRATTVGYIWKKLLTAAVELMWMAIQYWHTLLGPAYSNRDWRAFSRWRWWYSWGHGMRVWEWGGKW